MKVNIMKLVDEAVTPKKAHSTDAGLDLTATSMKEQKGMVIYGTGLAFEIPEGHVGLVFPRSSVSKTCLSLSNAVGVIDAGYRGEVMFKFREHLSPRDDTGRIYSVGDRIGQIIIMPIPEIEFEEVESLSDTSRGTGGYGSSGK